MTPEQVTPEKARELLRGDFGTEKRTEWLGNSQADFDSFTGAHIRSTPGDVALAEAAPALAELVAGLRYEYAVQVIEDGRTWWVTNYKSLTSASWGAAWLPTFNSADTLRRECATELCLQERRAEMFVVRKLATEPEVMDPEAAE